MSQENVEVVRNAIAAFNRGELDILAAAAEWYDPEVEFREDPTLPEPGVYRGAGAIEAYFRQFLDAFEDYRFDVEEVLDAGDHVVVFNRPWGRGLGSGAEVDMRNAWVFTFRGKKIVRITPYWERSKALEAVGLSEQDAHPADRGLKDRGLGG
jgi:ketosteroid isomerase-like protein